MTTTKPLDAGTSLAVERTWLAHERTLMAWVRTAASLISFGFTIYKFFQLEIGNRAPTERLIGPREFAIGMIAIGLVALVLASVGHQRSLRAMEQTFGRQPQRSTASVVAWLVTGLGLLAITLVILRH
jgi:putative membrane protein